MRDVRIRQSWQSEAAMTSPNIFSLSLAALRDHLWWMLSQQELESWLWGAANILRGKTAGQDYKTYILSLLFFKRLCDQYDFEADANIRKIQEDTLSCTNWRICWYRCIRPNSG